MKGTKLERCIIWFLLVVILLLSPVFLLVLYVVDFCSAITSPSIPHTM
jgi:hypothetical protein